MGDRILTNSMINAFRTCPMKYKFAYIDLLVSDIFHFPYVIGHATHDGIQNLLKFKSKNSAVESALYVMKKKQEEYSLNHTMSADEDQEYIFQCVNVEGIVTNYYIHKTDFIKNTKVLCLERKIISRKPVKGTEFFVTIKADAVIKYSGKKYLYEFKTTKSPSYNSIMSYYSQFVIYYMITSERYNIDGVYIDAIKKPQLKLGKNESHEDFLIRLEENYKSSDNFFYDIIIPQKTHLRQITDMVEDTAKQILKAEDKDRFTYNRYACRIYGQCEYLLLCDNGINPSTLTKYRKKTSVNEELE